MVKALAETAEINSCEEIELDDLIEQIGKILAEEYIKLMKEGEKNV